MRVVIAPDSFKECLGAGEVAAAIASGVVKAAPDAVIDICPMADGGEGTVAAIVAATAGRFITADVFDPLGRQIRAKFGLLGEGPVAALPGEVGLAAGLAQQGDSACECDGCAAVVEMAAASGLGLTPPGMRDPLWTTTFGTGQLITAALDAGARSIILGVGGSATVDGGAGCLQALGVVFIDGAGNPCRCGMGGGALCDVASIDVSGMDKRVRPGLITVAADVTNPLTGPQGAARVYGPQKGATPEAVEQLERGLEHFRKLVADLLGIDMNAISGAGAAGGLGGGIAAFTGAKISAGLGVIAKAVNLRQRISCADLVITGEGKLDASSAFGKTAVGVARMAGELGVSAVCIPGQVGAGAPRELFAAVLPLVGDGVTPAQAIESAPAVLELRARQAMAKYIKG